MIKLSKETPQTTTHIDVSYTDENSKYTEYRDTVRISYNVHTDNRVQFTSGLTLSREEAEKLYTQLGNVLFGFES